MKRLAITTGDQDGVGPEVTVKALMKSGPRRGFMPVVFRGFESERLFRRLSPRFRRVVVSRLADALDIRPAPSTLVEIVDGTAAPFWVETAARSCLIGELDGLITGPLSKPLIRACGFRGPGHTEILSRLAKRPDLFQAYVGDRFNVVLVTAHLPLRRVSTALTAERLRRVFAAADRFRLLLPISLRKKPAGILGLNPHAGDGGLIGDEERMISREITKARRRGFSLEGPLVPDAAFSEENWSKYSVFVAAYHDQGLIPFKMLHGRRRGAQLTLGLPFVRTSVDHGTAKEIAGRGIADPGSMQDAIEWCLRLSGKDV